MKYLWYYIETRFSLFLNLLGVKRNTKCIPKGEYCYEYDEERNAKEPTNGYWIKPCKYYRSMKGSNAACTYVGFIGFDPCLGDQCKMCGVNTEDENNEFLANVINRYLFWFEDEGKDGWTFEIEAKDYDEAYEKAYDTHGPQVEDMMYQLL